MAVPRTEAANGINRGINYQGRLMDASGNQVPDGTYQMVFRLYDEETGGSHLWSASTTNGLPTGPVAGVPVEVKNGLFSVVLGDTDKGQVPLDIEWDSPNIYLGVKIESDDEMSPRKKMTSVPYAFNSEKLQGQSASGTVQNTGGDQFAISQNASDVAVATRTALYVETKGASTAFDYILRLSNGGGDVFLVNREGDTQIAGSLDVAGQLDFGSASGIDASLSGNLWVDGTASSSEMLFINATGSNFGLLGFVTSDIKPHLDLAHSLGDASHRWQAIYLGNVYASGTSLMEGLQVYGNATTTNLVASGFVSTTALYINGQMVPTSTPNLQQVTDEGSVTDNAISFAGGTSTASLVIQGTASATRALFINATGTNLAILGRINSDLVPSLNDYYSLGSSAERWKFAFLQGLYASGTVLTQNLGVFGNVSLPANSITDAMASNGLMIDGTGNVSATSVNSGVLGNVGVTLNLSGFGNVTGTIGGEHVSLATSGNTVTLNDQTVFNIWQSNSVLFGGSVAQIDGDSVEVSAGQGFMRVHGTDNLANEVLASWSTTTVDVGVNEWNNIYVYYNNGTPVVMATSTALADYRYLRIAQVYTTGVDLAIHDERVFATQLREYLSKFLEENVLHVVSEGCLVSTTGTRNLMVSSCTEWYGAREKEIESFDSSGADTFWRVYRDGSGGHVLNAGNSQWDNLHFDDGSGTLADVSAGEYGVLWVYRHEAVENRVDLMYGDHSYMDLAEAATAALPTNLPINYLDGEHVFLIGAIIFQSGIDTPEMIRDLRPTIVTYGDGTGSGGGMSSHHNDLSGLQGGTVGQYYHMTATGFDAAGALTFSSGLNNDLSLYANGAGSRKVVINNIYAGVADLDIKEGSLMLASTTRITNAGFGYLTGLDLALGGITNAGSISGITHLSVSASSTLQDFTFRNATGSYLYLPLATILDFNSDTSTVSSLYWENAVGGNTSSTHLYAEDADFDNIFATNATFTKLVVMEHTNIHDLTFMNATGGNLVTYGAVSSTFINVLSSILGYATSHNMVVDETLRVGVGNFPIIGSSVAQFGGSTNTYLQVNIQNHSSGQFASSDFVATADNGDDSNYYIDLGINSSGYDNPDFSISGSNDGYLYTHGANLTIGTASSATAIIFHAGGTTDADEVMRLTSDRYLGIGTTNPSSTLHVVGSAIISDELTVSSVDVEELLWGSATGSVLEIASSAHLPSNTMVDGKLVCLADGTNCPSGAASSLQTVTNAGNVTTNRIQFAGGTSTAMFVVQNDVIVNGSVSSVRGLLIDVTSTNLGVLGYITSNLLPSKTDAYYLGNEAHRWLGLTVKNATATNVLALGYVSSSAMYINGRSVTTSVPTLQQVATAGNVSNRWLSFAGATSTANIVPSSDIYSLGTSAYRWSDVWSNKVHVGSGAGWDLAKAVDDAFTISRNGSENLRVATNGFVGIGTNNPQGPIHVSSTSAGIFTRNVNGVGGVQAAMQIGVTGNPAIAGAGPSYLFFANDSTGQKEFLGRLNAIWENPINGSETAGLSFTVRANAGDASASTEAMRITSSGYVGIGTSSPSSKLTVNGRVTIQNAEQRDYQSWVTSAYPSTGIENVWSMAEFNGYLYAGQGDTAGDGDIKICDPSVAGDSLKCDNALDWSNSYLTATYSRVNSLVVYRGRLYAAMGLGAGLGDVAVCNPALTGDSLKCDTGDWSDTAFPAGPTAVKQLMVYDGLLYAANYTGAAGSAAVAVCTPENGGSASVCDVAADWNNITIPVAGTYEEINGLVVFNKRLYGYMGNSNGDDDIVWCTPTNGGSAEKCDNTADWNGRLNNPNGYSTIDSAAVYNGFMYLGLGNGASQGDVVRCDPAQAGDDTICDAAADLNNVTPIINNAMDEVSAMTVYDGVLELGYTGISGEGDIMEYRGSYTTTTNNGTGFEATNAFVVYKGVLYAGRGNAAGNGQVWHYAKERVASNDILFEAGSSTGSFWFSDESLNYPGEGTNFQYQMGAFKFSHGIITDAGAFDLAEKYPTTDNTLGAGEVVAMDEDNYGYVRRSGKRNERNLVGVISTKPGFTLSGPDSGYSKAIALVGRTQVRVTGENGDVAVGDPLTSASTPGYAMKATEPGMIVGHALESFASTTNGIVDATGTVMMVVQTGYYFGSQESSLGQLAGFLGESTSTQIIQQAFAGDAYAIEQIKGGLLNPQLADGSALNGTEAAMVGTLIVKTAALITGDMTVAGDSRLLGHIVVASDTAGIVDLPIGESYVEIQFTEPFEDLPVVVVTPESDADENNVPWMGGFRISKKTINGFRIEVDQPACDNPDGCGRTMKFNWMALGKQDEALVSATTTEATADVISSEADGQESVGGTTIEAATSTETVPVPEVVVEAPTSTEPLLPESTTSTEGGDGT